MRERRKRINYGSGGLGFDHPRVSAIAGRSHFSGAPLISGDNPYGCGGTRIRRGGIRPPARQRPSRASAPHRCAWCAASTDRAGRRGPIGSPGLSSSVTFWKLESGGGSATWAIDGVTDNPPSAAGRVSPGNGLRSGSQRGSRSRPRPCSGRRQAAAVESRRRRARRCTRPRRPYRKNRRSSRSR